MRRLLFLILLPSLFLASCTSAKSETTSDLFAVPLVSLAGDPVSLADTEGTVVVNFWASYCKPCIREMPALQKTADAHPEVRFIGINALDDRELAEKLVAETQVRYEIWLDDRGDAMRAAGVRSLPGTFIIKDGSVLFSKLGEISEKELTEALSRAAS